MKIQRAVAIRVSNLLSQHKITQYELAKRMATSQSTVKHIIDEEYKSKFKLAGERTIELTWRKEYCGIYEYEFNGSLIANWGVDREDLPLEYEIEDYHIKLKWTASYSG